MNLFPASLALAIPTAASAASKVVQTVSNGFQELLSDDSKSAQSASAGQPLTLSDKLSDLASNLRNWLTERGINTPFEIEVRAADSSAGSSSSAISGEPATLEVRGSQSAQVRQLIQQSPEQLGKLSGLLNSIRALSNGSSNSTKISITDLDSTISY